MDTNMWRKALVAMPNVSKTEWEGLDVVSRWLISTRAAVLVMTFISAALAGLFAWRDNSFSFFPWVALTLGLILAHASNNIFNDFTDYIRGVDKENYYRNIYGAQPVASGLMTKKQHLTYFGVTVLTAFAFGWSLVLFTDNDPITWLLIGLGAFFLMFYTWPLKGLALGEIAVLIVWGPLMIGGGYFVLAGKWNWDVVLASLPYVLGVTSVIFGKHIDKLDMDKSKKINTLPVLLGERVSRYIVLGMIVASYLISLYLVLARYFTPIILIVFLALPAFNKIYPVFLKAKPVSKPKNQTGWPLYFVGYTFIHNRKFGSLFMIGILIDVLLRIMPLTSELIRHFWL